jgi:flavin-dependent dehydrogenase
VIHDALIIGSGPAGSTAARLLARAGWSVALVEKSVFPRRKVCGEFISASSLPLLDIADVGTGFFSQAGPEIRRVALFTGPTTVVSAMPQAPNGALAWGRALGREHLDGLLRDAAVRAGARLFQPFKLVGLQRTGEAYLGQIEGEHGVQDLAARIVIAANGSWERGVLSIPPPPRRAGDLLAFKAHFHASDLPEDLMPLLMFPGGYGGMAPTDDGRVSLSCCIRRDALAQTRRRYPALAAGEAVLEHIREHCAGVRGALRQAELAGVFLSAGPIRPGIRQAHRAGIFRIGNAAGEAHPIIAEGISMAIQSSWLLCRHLTADRRAIVDGRDTDAMGAAYAKDWTGRFAPRIHAAASLAHLAMKPATAALTASVVKRFPQLLTWGARISGKALSLDFPVRA